MVDANLLSGVVSSCLGWYGCMPVNCSLFFQFDVKSSLQIPLLDAYHLLLVVVGSNCFPRRLFIILNSFLELLVASVTCIAK